MSDPSKQIDALLAKVPDGAGADDIAKACMRAGHGATQGDYVDGHPAPLADLQDPRGRWFGRCTSDWTQFERWGVAGKLVIVILDNTPYWIDPSTRSFSELTQRHTTDGPALAKSKPRYIDARPAASAAVEPARQSITTLADVAKLSAECQRMKAQRTKLDSERARFVKQRRLAENDRTTCTELLNAAALEAVLAGIDPPAPDPVIAEKLRAADRTERAVAQALEVSAAKIAAHDLAASEAEATYLAGVFNYLTGEHEEAASIIRSMIEPLGEPLARLIALDEVRSQICGPRPKISGPSARNAPWSGSVVALNLAKAIAPKIRPTAIEETTLKERAGPLATNLLKQLKGFKDV